MVDRSPEAVRRFRLRGIAYLVGGPLLAVASGVLAYYFVQWRTENPDTYLPDLLTASPALGFVVGIIFFYVGAMRLALGERVMGIKLEDSAGNPAALLYFGGFALMVIGFGVVAIYWFIGELFIPWLPPPP